MEVLWCVTHSKPAALKVAWRHVCGNWFYDNLNDCAIKPMLLVDKDVLRPWFGAHLWAEDDFGGLRDASLVELFDLVAPEWRGWTAEHVLVEGVKP